MHTSCILQIEALRREASFWTKVEEKLLERCTAALSWGGNTMCVQGLQIPRPKSPSCPFIISLFFPIPVCMGIYRRNASTLKKNRTKEGRRRGNLDYLGSLAWNRTTHTNPALIGMQRPGLGIEPEEERNSHRSTAAGTIVLRSSRNRLGSFLQRTRAS